MPELDAALPPRPDFMVTLGLLPPYSVEDVKRAYFEKAKSAHPDHHGDAAEFIKLQEAYEKAVEYAGVRASRMHWLGSWIERYAEQEQLVEELHRRGAIVQVESSRPVQNSIGEDFAQVLESINAVRLADAQNADGAIDLLVAKRHLLGTLRTIDLSASDVTDPAVRRLGHFQGLHRIDLTGTRVTHQGVRLLPRLPELHQLALAGTRVPWWRRWLLGGKLRRRAHK